MFSVHVFQRVLTKHLAGTMAIPSAVWFSKQNIIIGQYKLNLYLSKS